MELSIECCSGEVIDGDGVVGGGKDEFVDVWHHNHVCHPCQLGLTLHLGGGREEGERGGGEEEE